MSNEKNMQRKWDREEVIILVTEATVYKGYKQD